MTDIDEIVKKLKNDDEKLKKSGLDVEQLEAFRKMVNVSDDSEKRRLAELLMEEYKKQGMDATGLLLARCMVYGMLGLKPDDEATKKEVENWLRENKNKK